MHNRLRPPMECGCPADATVAEYDGPIMAPHRAEARMDGVLVATATDMKTLGKTLHAAEVVDAHRQECGCEESAGTLGTMVRDGRNGPGHYAQDGDFLGPCQTDAQKRNAQHSCGAQGFGFGDTCLGCGMDEHPAAAGPDCAPTPAVGVKHDSGKAPLSLLGMVTRALADVARVQAFGAKKYPSPDNWKHIPDGARRYRDAALRHLFADIRGEVFDPETGLSHLAHAACNLLIAAEHDMGFEEIARPPVPPPPDGEKLPAWRFGEAPADPGPRASRRRE